MVAMKHFTVTNEKEGVCLEVPPSFKERQTMLIAVMEDIVSNNGFARDQIPKNAETSKCNTTYRYGDRTADR